MPYGLSWPRFICFSTAAFLAMATGSQMVHLIYRPLDDLDDLIEVAFQKRLSELHQK
ncbi:PREDICTED: uncharacterized protein LOC108573821 [Habropoda laboriosa]|uniref:uncharacterized protein LOC108573821 n=1 Tax=Habropoda laboriosa TaxID=597456 RepID=UPI00083CC404|nr:PREDICTED: uncharacterized protein LOC108573821 [Habropoda laboriosa]